MLHQTPNKQRRNQAPTSNVPIQASSTVRVKLRNSTLDAFPAINFCHVTDVSIKDFEGDDSNRAVNSCLLLARDLIVPEFRCFCVHTLSFCFFVVLFIARPKTHTSHCHLTKRFKPRLTTAAAIVPGGRSTVYYLIGIAGFVLGLRGSSPRSPLLHPRDLFFLSRVGLMEDRGLPYKSYTPDIYKFSVPEVNCTIRFWPRLIRVVRSLGNGYFEP